MQAVCQNPRQKKSRIQRFCTRGGEYLGDTAVMRVRYCTLNLDASEKIQKIDTNGTHHYFIYVTCVGIEWNRKRLGRDESDLS